MRFTLCICFIFLLLVSESKAQMTINSAITNVNLVQQYLLGPGVCAKNIRWTGTQNQRARFTCTNNCNIGFSSGVLITSGNAANAIGPNTATGTTGALGLPGDPNLNALAPGLSSNDAGVLEFDFSVPSDSIEFRFVFASEEYNDYVNTNCNDVFGFFISGQGYAGPTNVALIPNTTTQITINNVNNGNSAAGVVPTGPCSNCAYYRDNTGGVGTEYDGMTTVLTAKAAVVPCTMYHFKMGVQDNCDQAFDSGVFFEANSFQATGEIPLYADGDTLEANDTVYICTGDTINLSLPSGPNTLWSTGATTAAIKITQPGIYYGTLSDTCCFAFSVVLTVLPQPQIANATAQGPTSFCNGDSVIITATPNGPGLTYVWSNGATTSSITVKNTGNYSVSIGNGGNCIAVSPTVQVNVNNNPLSVISPSGPTTFCTGGSVTLTSANTASTYLWSTGQTTASIPVNTTGTYTLTVSNNGCSSTSSQNVVVNTPSLLSISIPAVPCTGSPATMVATSGFSSYLWANGSTTSSIVVATGGTFSVTATNANSCTSTSQTTFTPLPFTTPTIAAPSGFCAGQNATLQASTGYASYLWNNGISSSSINVSTAGNYTVTVTAANGCTGTAMSNLNLWTLPSVVINGTFIVCSGTPANLTVASNASFYNWSNGATTQTITPSTAGAYTVTVTDNNNCSASTVQFVTVNMAPVINITGDFDACQGNQGLMDAGSGFSAYNWSTGAATSSISPATQGWYYVTVTNNGCSSIDSAFFTVHSHPSPTIAGNPNFCPGQSTTLNVAQNFSTYLWSTGVTTQTVTITTPSALSVTVTDANGCLGSTGLNVNTFPPAVPVLPATPSICNNSSYLLQPGNFQTYLWSDNSTTSTLSVNAAGTYTVTVTDFNGCIGSTTSTLQVNPAPTPVINGPSAICNGQVATFTTGTYNAYLWSDGTVNPQLTTVNGGSYSVTVTDFNGCTASTSTSLIVHPLPLVAISGPPNFCEGGSSTITTPAGQGTYEWSTGATSNTILVTGTANYQVTVTSAFGCTSSNNYLVTERPDPKVDFTILQSPACNEILVQFTNTTLAENGTAYLWDFGDNTRSIKTSPQHSYYLPGDYTVQLFATSPFGCTGTDTSSLNVSFPPAPVAGFTFSPDLVNIYNSKIRFINTSQNAVRYKWNFGDGLYSEEVNPEHHFDRIGEQIITLFAYNSESCYDEYQLPVEVAPFWIPNAFTPNNDGKNDIFFEGGYVMDIQSFHMEIFDRWGMKMYATDAFDKPWDGTYNGVPAKEDLYTYLINVISVKGKETQFKGTFRLIR